MSGALAHTALESIPAPGERCVGHPLAGLAAIGVVAVALRIAFFTGYHGYDDIHYIQRAFDLSEGVRSLPQTAWAGRIGLVGPTALAYAALGVTPVTTNLFPFACSLLGIAAVYMLGRRLFDEGTGLLAALLLAFLPIDVLSAGQLFANSPVSLLAGIGFGCFVLAERDDDPRAYFCSGLGLGLATLVHEAVVMTFAAYPACLALTRGPTRRHALIGIGFALGLGIEPIAHGILLGAPLARLEGLSGSHARMMTSVAEDVAYSGFNLAWIGEGLLRPFSERTFGLYTWLLAPALWFGARSAKPSVERALAVLVVVGGGWILFGSISPTHYSPLSRMPRYLIPLALPSTWLLAHWLLRQPLARRSLLLVALGLSSIGCLLIDSGNALIPYERAAEIIAPLSPARVVVDPTCRFPLEFAERMRPSYELTDFNGERVAPGTLLVVRTPELREQISNAPGLELVAEIEPPATLYRRMLGMASVMSLLRVVRPPERFAEYASKAASYELSIHRAR